MSVPAPIEPPVKAPVAFGPRGVQITSLDDLFRWGQAVVQSSIAPPSFKTPQQVIVAVQWGAELGFGPMQSLAALPVINGRPTLMVEPANALVMASGLLTERHDRFEGEGASRVCIVALVRKGKLAIERRFSVEDAKRAGLERKDVWRGYPDRMLYARALGYALKDLFPDVLRGMPIAETLDEFDGPPEPEERNITPPRRPAEVGPDPLLAQLQSGAAATIELDVEPELVAAFVEESADGQGHA